MKTQLVIILAVLSACLISGEGALLGSNKCTYGPGYWCDSLKNAKECNAVTHCIQTVWEKQRLPEDNDDICTLCKNMVQEARDQLLSNETQEEIREVFEGSCRLIPIRVIKDECIHLADDFIPELIDTLASQMNPQVVCATAGLCNSVAIDRLLRNYRLDNPEVESNAIVVAPQVNHPEPGDCEACKDFIARTIRIVKTHSRAEVLDRLLAVCGRLGSLSDGCMALVQVNFESIYNFITQQLTPEDFCDLVEMCENRMTQSGEYKRPALQHSDDEPCDFCVAIVEHWRTILISNTTEMEFKQILDGLCHQAGRFKKNCLALVDEYYLPLYNLLVSEIHPKQICEAVGLCGLNSVFGPQRNAVWMVLDVEPEEETIPQVPLLPSLRVGPEHESRMTGGDEAVAINFENRQEAAASLPRVKLTQSGIAVSPVGANGVVGAAVGKGRVGDDNKCVMCEFAIHFLQTMLEQKDTRKDIEDAIEQLCDLMPHSVAEECEDYVEAYGDQVIELLAQELDPSQICTAIHLCPASVNLEVAQQDVNEDVSCVMCEYALTQLDDMLEDNKTEASIRAALDRLCGMLPRTIRAECQVFVDTYTEQVIKMLVDNLSPDEVCTKLGLCKSKESELPRLDSSHQLPVSRLFVPSLSSGSSNDDEEYELEQSAACVLCEFAMVQLDELLSDNTTEDEIIEMVDYVCAHLPGTLQDDCIGFVDEYGDAIIKLLVHELSPKTVCQAIKLCKAPSFTGMRAVVNVNLDKCQICKGVVNYVDERLKDGDATTTIDTILEEVCRLLPRNAQGDCRSMIEVYGPYLVNLLAELGDGDRVCQGLELCPTESDQQLLGGERCMWGPSYWCQTQLHAISCEMTAWCEERIWKGVHPMI